MFSLELTKANATLDNLNPRTEKHGPDKVPAATLKISTPQTADILAFFSPTLRGFLFDEEGGKDLLGDGARLKQPHLEYPLALDNEMTGAKVSIEYGVGKPLDFDDCVVGDFRITPMEGGTVVLGFKVACKPNESQIGKLYLLQEAAISVTVDPPELREMGAEK